MTPHPAARPCHIGGHLQCPALQNLAMELIQQYVKRIQGSIIEVKVRLAEGARLGAIHGYPLATEVFWELWLRSFSCVVVECCGICCWVLDLAVIINYVVAFQPMYIVMRRWDGLGSSMNRSLNIALVVGMLGSSTGNLSSEGCFFTIKCVFLRMAGSFMRGGRCPTHIHRAIPS